MNFLTITIHRDEIEKCAGKKLSPEKLNQVFSAIEGDVWLWKDIEESIKNSLDYVGIKPKE